MEWGVLMRHDSEQHNSDIEGLLRAVRPDTTPRPGFQEELLERLLRSRETSEKIVAGRRVVLRHGRSISRIAAGLAAMFVVAVAAWWFLGGPVSQASATFADVLTSIRQARTVTFDAKCFSPDGEEVVTHVDISYPGRIRVTMADGRVHITDMIAGKRLNLTPSKNHAVLRSTTTDPACAEPLNDLRQAVASQGHLVGSETLKGRHTEIFQVVLTGATLRVWVDPGEDFPVRIESRTMQDNGQEAIAMTLDNFSWNAHVSDSLFSLLPPDGYALSEPEAEASEQSLIDLLKICSQNADGCFPDSLDDVVVLNVVTKRHLDEFYISTTNSGDVPSPITITGQARDDYKSCLRGLAFVKRVADIGMWHYAGKGIMFGDRAAVVCWWQLPGTTNVRVVHGDLTVTDMAAGELPATTE
jgi:outer membrane lipoprotein-sorting protein